MISAFDAVNFFHGSHGKFMPEIQNERRIFLTRPVDHAFPLKFFFMIITLDVEDKVFISHQANKKATGKMAE